MWFWINRALSVAVWGVHVLRWYRTEDGPTTFLFAWFLFAGVALNWFGEALGAGSGYDVWRSPNIHPIIDALFMRRLRVDTPTDAWPFQILGWAILLGPWWLAYLMAPRMLHRP